MPTILAIDTSATPVSCAILRDDRVLVSYFSHTGLTHSQTLMPMIESALETARMSVSDMDALAVTAGPGSFTGVRIGVAAVKGLAFADDLPCISVSTLSAMARNVQGLPFEGVVCCAMDARCRQVYCALFAQDSNGTQHRLTPDEAISIDTLRERLVGYDQPIMFIGDGAQVCYDALIDALPNSVLAPLSVRLQCAVGVALEARDAFERGETVDAQALLPTYLRLPQAERELRSRQAAEATTGK